MARHLAKLSILPSLWMLLILAKLIEKLKHKEHKPMHVYLEVNPIEHNASPSTLTLHVTGIMSASAATCI